MRSWPESEQAGDRKLPSHERELPVSVELKSLFNSKTREYSPASWTSLQSLSLESSSRYLIGGIAKVRKVDERI